MKFIVKVAIVEPCGGFRYLTLRECTEYEDAELARRAYLRRNPALPLIIEHSLSEEAGRSNFEKITASPETLAAFLSSLPVLSGPWDEDFHRRYCDACPAEECGECENKALNNPLWWLSLAAEEGEV